MIHQFREEKVVNSSDFLLIRIPSLMSMAWCSAQQRNWHVIKLITITWSWEIFHDVSGFLNFLQTKNKRFNFEMKSRLSILFLCETISKCFFTSDARCNSNLRILEKGNQVADELKMKLMTLPFYDLYKNAICGFISAVVVEAA